MLPNTTTGKTGRRRRAGPGVVAACFVLLLLVAALALGQRGFSPGEDLLSPAVKDVAVSPEDTSYPDSDALRFDDQPEVLYVYVRFEDLSTHGDLTARVERTARTPVLHRLFGTTRLRIVNGEKERLGASGAGVSGVVKFAVRTQTGEPLPSGSYTVSIYAPREAGSSTAVARKYFAVGN